MDEEVGSQSGMMSRINRHIDEEAGVIVYVSIYEGNVSISTVPIEKLGLTDEEVEEMINRGKEEEE